MGRRHAVSYVIKKYAAVRGEKIDGFIVYLCIGVCVCGFGVLFVELKRPGERQAAKASCLFLTPRLGTSTKAPRTRGFNSDCRK